MGSGFAFVGQHHRFALSAFGDHRFFAGQIRIGGWIGYAMTRAAVMAVNEVGLAIFLWTGLAALLCFYTERTWSEIVQRPREQLTDMFVAWWGGFKSAVIYLSKPITPRMMARGAATVSNASGTQTFFKISAEPKGKRIEQEEDDEAAEDSIDTQSVSSPPIETAPADSEDDGGLVAPITGFLKEQFTVTKPKKSIPVKIQRRVENWELPKLSLLDDPPASRPASMSARSKAKRAFWLKSWRSFQSVAKWWELSQVLPSPCSSLNPQRM